MSEAAAKQRNDKALNSLIDGIVSALGDAVGSLVSQPLVIKPGGAMTVQHATQWLAGLDGTKAVIRGALERDLADHHLMIVIDQVEAIGLSGYLMMTPEEVITEYRNAGAFDKDHLEAFGEVGNVVCSSVDGALRQALGPGVGLRLRDTGTLGPGVDQSGILPAGELVVYGFSIQIGEYPQSTGYVVIDLDTAQQWNDQTPIRAAGVGGASAGIESATDSTELPDETVEEDIPQAPIRAKLSAFIVSTAVKTIIRQCGKRVGLEIQRFASTDIPNPSAHRGEIVLIEVPVGAVKRFDWARRIKQQHPGIPVALLIHEPSRARVVQGFMTQADIIVAWPSAEPQLSAKLEPLIDKVLESADDD